VLIMLDDTGFGASSTFGGPAETPALDQLAARGLKYNRFHVTPICSPTRAALLSGRNSHRVGFGHVVNVATPFPGYNGVWKKDNASLAEILRRHGYNTAAFGKWHNTPRWEISPAGPFDRWPTSLGFEYFYGFLDGSTSQYEPALYRNTTTVEPANTPEQGYHFTTDMVDDAIGWLHTQRATASEKPFFLYLAPGATHAPLHAPSEWIAKYRGKFDQARKSSTGKRNSA
jgi:arylsulfatase